MLVSGLRNDSSVRSLQPLHDPQHGRRVPRAVLGSRHLSRFQFAGDGAGRHALGDTFLSELGFLSNYLTGAAAPGLKLLFARTDGR